MVSVRLNGMAHRSLESLNLDVPKKKVIRFAVVLQANVALERPVFHGRFIQLYIDNFFSVQFHQQVVAFASDNHLVPFAGILGHVL